MAIDVPKQIDNVDDTYFSECENIYVDTVKTIDFDKYEIYSIDDYPKEVRDVKDSLFVEWNMHVMEKAFCVDTIDGLICQVSRLSEELLDKQTDGNTISILGSLKNTYDDYIVESQENYKTTFSEGSVDSLRQFLRYIPDIASLHHSVYVEKDTGFFGVMLKSSKKSKPLLNLVLRENGEVLFSFVNKKTGMIKISGTAYFNHNLEDSREIRHLLRMIKF
ncbi:TPA: hypothetical protein NJ378_003696 [Vibrio parahaemolyticus]|nr:hypothetical protein [Vibrio parahaemolyticus]